MHAAFCDQLMSRRLSNYVIAALILILITRRRLSPLVFPLFYFDCTIPRPLRSPTLLAVSLKSVKILRPFGSISHETFQFHVTISLPLAVDLPLLFQTV